MAQSEGVVYRVIPKCACSTIGQIIYYADHGAYYDGDIHDAKSGIHKWAFEESRPRIEERARDETFTFTCIRNPWTRILSSFFDKIAGIQRSGNRYRERQFAPLMKRYGVDIEGDFDQIGAFRHFLLFARDTIRFRKPIDPDIHWSAVSGHASTLIANGGRYDQIISTEDFAGGMAEVLTKFEQAHPVDLAKVPRFNESEGHGPKRLHPIEDYFDDMSIFLMHEIYRRDFNLFNYGKDPNGLPPRKDIDLDFVHAKLGPKA
jgi:hypothetical protein